MRQRHRQTVSRDTFYKHLKTFLFALCSVLIQVQRIRGFTTMRYINLRFTYLQIDVDIQRSDSMGQSFWGDRLSKSSAVAEMSDRGHNRHGPKRGAGCCMCPFRGAAGSRLTQHSDNVVWAEVYLHQVASSSIQLFGHNRDEPKTGGCAPFSVELRVHLTHHRRG